MSDITIIPIINSNKDNFMKLRTPILDKENRRMIVGIYKDKQMFIKPGDNQLFTDDGPTGYYIQDLERGVWK